MQVGVGLGDQGSGRVPPTESWGGQVYNYRCTTPAVSGAGSLGSQQEKGVGPAVKSRQ